MSEKVISQSCTDDSKRERHVEVKVRTATWRFWGVASILAVGTVGFGAPPTYGQCTTGADCDDGIPCTQNQCFNGSCRFNPVDDVCDDTLYCNGVETCDVQQGCVAGVPPCIGNSCAEDMDQCSCTADADCNDGLFCNGVEACVGGSCEHGADPCADAFNCTADFCDEVMDQCTHAPDDSECDDGLFCNGVETCDVTLGCVNGTFPCNDGVACTADNCDEIADICKFPSTCNDGIACTIDVCQDDGSCMFYSDNTICDNGTFCDGVETCDPPNGDPVTGCTSGASPDCDDGVACTIDSCTETGCVHLPDLAVCDDGIPCTIDTCDAVNGCQHTPDDNACDDRQFCNGAEICSPLLGCVTGIVPCFEGRFCTDPCDDGLDCTTDTCDEEVNTCTNTNICDDGIDCTADVCSLIGCQFIPSQPRCDDGVFCNGAEICDPPNGDFITGCKPGTVPACADNLGCTIDQCDVLSDSCIHTDDCDDAIACTADSCTAEGCLHDEDELACDDGVGCTFDVCQVAFGGCRNILVDGYCDDEFFCTGVETCDPGTGDVITGCRTGSDPCPGQVCSELINSCSLCVDDSGCSAGKVCCGGICRSCCTDGDCPLPGSCCTLAGRCSLDCGGITPTEE